MPLGTTYPFGLRDVKLTPLTTDLDVPGTAVDLPASRTLTYTDAEDFETLRGDDKNIVSRGSGSNISWELEAGGLSMEAYSVFAGVTVVATGTTPSQIKTMSKKATDSRPYFRAEGQAISDSGGDVHVVLYRCKATGDLEGSFGDGEFFLTKCSGEAFPSRATASLDALYDVVQNETAASI